MANDGTALGALKEIIGNAGGTSDAQTLVPAIEDLGEIIGSGGGGGGTIPDGSITTAKLANGAVTSDKLDSLAVAQRNIKQDAVGNHQLADDAVHTDNILDGSVTIDKIDSNAKKELTSGVSYATDATTAQALTAFGFNLTVITPKEIYNHPAQPQRDARSRLFWLDTNTGYLDSGVMMLSGSIQTQAITVWAKGLHSTATGVLGVDESWTITANA